MYIACSCDIFNNNNTNSSVEVVPLVFGALGALHEKTVKNFELLLLTEVSVHQLQKAMLLKTDIMLRKHLSL